ncbi:hypothetical protein JOAD_49 [Erwinia phage vB_EamM_Joad]|uniref:Uncharacterized protein n=1 Tax=Erwinia phage vB_EamM_Joad TaxID=2026081 RepID=A0A223LJV7_9CAUD|nr:hypothetical protein JOAD_49 [Erwinia phage vB_EamM_Joad]
MTTQKTTPKAKAPGKLVLATIVAECAYKGQQAVMQGKHELEENGFESAKVSRCCNGRRREHKGCVFEYVSEKEAQNHERGFSPETRVFLTNIIHFMTPVITGVNEETGEEIVMNTASDMKARGFVPAKVRAIINKDKTYNGWKFTRKDPGTLK